METINLKVSQKIYSEVIELLNKFDPEDIEIVEPLKESPEFLRQKAYLQEQLDSIDNGTAKFVTIEELERRLENTISRHENKHP